MKTFVFLFLSLSLAAQINPVKVNDTLWAIQTVTIKSNSGARTIEFSDFADSAKIWNAFRNVMESKYNILASRVNEREFAAMDSVLQAKTGESFEVMVKNRISQELKGRWIIKDSTHTYNIVIDKSIVKDTTGKVLGSIEINSRESVTINGIINQPLVFRATTQGVIAVVNKTKYYLIKEQTKGS